MPVVERIEHEPTWGSMYVLKHDVPESSDEYIYGTKSAGGLDKHTEDRKVRPSPWLTTGTAELVAARPVHTRLEAFFKPNGGAGDDAEVEVLVTAPLLLTQEGLTAYETLCSQFHALSTGDTGMKKHADAKSMVMYLRRAVVYVERAVQNDVVALLQRPGNLEDVRAPETQGVDALRCLLCAEGILAALHTHEWWCMSEEFARINAVLRRLGDAVGVALDRATLAPAELMQLARLLDTVDRDVGDHYGLHAATEELLKAATRPDAATAKRTADESSTHPSKRSKPDDEDSDVAALKQRIVARAIAEIRRAVHSRAGKPSTLVEFELPESQVSLILPGLERKLFASPEDILEFLPLPTTVHPVAFDYQQAAGAPAVYAWAGYDGLTATYTGALVRAKGAPESSVLRLKFRTQVVGYGLPSCRRGGNHAFDEYIHNCKTAALLKKWMKTKRIELLELTTKPAAKPPSKVAPQNAIADVN